jgi:hypothetical protein
MAITSCQTDFQPRFDGVDGSVPQLGKLVLNQTHMDEVSAMPTTIRYFTSGATANSYYYDEYYLGNPGHYKTYFVGINDACPISSSIDQTRFSLFGLSLANVRFDPSNESVRAFRSEAVANTYAETGIFFDPLLLDSFKPGADRILTRTAPPLPAEAK